MLLIDVNQAGLDLTTSKCQALGAKSVTTLNLDVTDTAAVRSAIYAYDISHPIDALYPCAALNDTPKKPLSDCVKVRSMCALLLIIRTSQRFFRSILLEFITFYSQS